MKKLKKRRLQQQRRHANIDRRQIAKSRQAPHGPLPSRALPADKLALFNHLDKFSGLRNALRQIAEERGDWAGIPMPLDGERLVIEPKFPKAEGLAAIGAPEPRPDTGETMRNRFWSWSKRGMVMVWNETDGRIGWGIDPGHHHISMDLHTLGCSQAWGIEQEGNAVQTLGSLVSHHQFRQYLMTGMFLETSKRSHLTYVFRRLRPTLALRMEEKVRILAALCMHPIAHYAGTWAGAMCPTDDVVAHLMLMRGDEPMYWRRANQHPAWRPEAGL